MSRRMSAGDPISQGVTWDGSGVNVAIFSGNATAVELCLFDGDDDAERETRISLPYRTFGVWHARISDVAPGQRYGFRVHGPYDPVHGQRFNPNKLLLDPYARAVEGAIDWSEPVFGYQPESNDLDLSFDDRDSAPGVPRSVVIDEEFDWRGDSRPNIPWSETIIYEVHVKGFTARREEIPPELRGTYAGFAHPASIDHLQRLGITAVELLPIHDFSDETHLTRHGLKNYWGYSTTSYFAPTARYSSSRQAGGQVNEFKEMVRTLHAAGIEVILDVVYNHTSEGNEFGPTINFRGIDNSTYYRLAPGLERYYVDYTGTGNTFNVGHPQVLKLIMDSLRYWVAEMHVDGFRFDLAATLARELEDVDHLAAFFDIIHQDPVLSRIKLIAEPWDVGEGGYQVGKFPVLWTEWNAEFRDTVRRFWRGDEHHVDDLALRLTGSSDLYAPNGRGPLASINFVTAHDGFTLQDLVSYETKHNDANMEENLDGTDNNLSRNYGVEGPTTDPAIVAIRERQKRNLLVTLILAQGVPMLLGGDEIGRTQQGNNNAYCQDNEISWFDWDLDETQRELNGFVSRVIAIRKEHPSFRRTQFFTGTQPNGSPLKDITWLRPDGQEMTAEDWYTSWARSFGAIIDGEGLIDLGPEGEPLRDATLLFIMNAYEGGLEFTIPAFGPDNWTTILDTATPRAPQEGRCIRRGQKLVIEGHSLVVLQEA